MEENEEDGELKEMIPLVHHLLVMCSGLLLLLFCCFVVVIVVGVVVFMSGFFFYFFFHNPFSHNIFIINSLLKKIQPFFCGRTCQINSNSNSSFFDFSPGRLSRS